MEWANFSPTNVSVNTLASGRRQGCYSEFGEKDRFHKTLLEQRGEPPFGIKGLWDLEICRHVVGPGACLEAKPGAFSQQKRGHELKTRERRPFVSADTSGPARPQGHARASP